MSKEAIGMAMIGVPVILLALAMAALFWRSGERGKAVGTLVMLAAYGWLGVAMHLVFGGAA